MDSRCQRKGVALPRPFHLWVADIDPKPLRREISMDRIREFLKSEDGPTATEYAVMLALIIIAALTAITNLGTKVTSVFTNVESKLPAG